MTEQVITGPEQAGATGLGTAYPRDRDNKLRYRAELLSKARKSPGLQSALRDRCAQDILYWLNTFGYIYEPRWDLRAKHGSLSPHLPFLTYDFQDELVLEYQRHIEQGIDLVNEKSRDMGVT